MPTTTIAPMLSVRNGARAVAFYKEAFAAREILTIEAPDGAVVAESAVEGAKFWVADESPEHLNFSPETLGGATARMVIVVTERAAVHARAGAASATRQLGNSAN